MLVSDRTGRNAFSPLNDEEMKVAINLNLAMWISLMPYKFEDTFLWNFLNNGVQITVVR